MDVSSQVPFRIAVLVVLSSAVAIALPRRLAAASSKEKVSHEAEGYGFAAVLRLCGLAMWIGVAAFLVDPAWVARSNIGLSDVGRWLGVPFAAAGLTLMRGALSHLGKNLTDTVVVRTDATFVSTGPYRYVRHPFYVAAAGVMTGVTLLADQWSIGLPCLVCLAMLVIRTPKEEAMLVARFGDAYRRYTETTGRFMPRLPR